MEVARNPLTASFQLVYSEMSKSPARQRETYMLPHSSSFTPGMSKSPARQHETHMPPCSSSFTLGIETVLVLQDDMFLLIISTVRVVSKNRK
jgi:hypothetical protein